MQHFRHQLHENHALILGKRSGKHVFEDSFERSLQRVGHKEAPQKGVTAGEIAGNLELRRHIVVLCEKFSAIYGVEVLDEVFEQTVSLSLGGGNLGQGVSEVVFVVDSIGEHALAFEKLHWLEEVTLVDLRGEGLGEAEGDHVHQAAHLVLEDHNVVRVRELFPAVEHLSEVGLKQDGVFGEVVLVVVYFVAGHSGLVGEEPFFPLDVWYVDHDSFVEDELGSGDLHMLVVSREKSVGVFLDVRLDKQELVPD